MVLDLTSGRLADAITHAEKALESVRARLTELRDGLNGQLEPPPQEVKKDVKGKGKLTGARLFRGDSVHQMTKVQIENEIKELDELQEDLALKV
jgi:HAT1-interacting factor 1